MRVYATKVGLLTEMIAVSNGNTHTHTHSAINRLTHTKTQTKRKHPITTEACGEEM